MGELTVENHADAPDTGPPLPPPPPPPAAHPRRPRVREVSSRFMSPVVSSSAESPRHHHHHHLTAKSPVHRHNLGSTPIPNPSDPRPRSSSANRRRRQLDMEQTLDDSDPHHPPPPPPPPPQPQAPISDPQFHLERVPSSTLRRQRPAKPMKENIGNRQTPIPNHHASKKGPARPDTPMLSASLDRSISVPSRFRATHQRPGNSSGSVACSAAEKLLQSSMSSSQASESAAEDCRDGASQLSSSTQSLPEFLVKAGNRSSTDSMKPLSAFPASRYVNSPFGSVPCLPPPVPPGAAAKAPAPKVKKGSSHQDDYNSLRLLQNRYLQWRYANARAEASARALERETQAKVNSLRVKMSEMYDSVAKKRIELGILRRTQALSAILEAQIPYLDQWSDLEGDYSVSLAESIQALLNASIQLPLGGNIRVDVKELEESLSSALKVMESIASYIQHLFPKAAEIEILMSELAKIVGGEKALVEECGDLLSNTYGLQVEQCSLRSQIIQLHAVRTLGG